VCGGGGHLRAATERPVRNSPVNGECLKERDWVAQTWHRCQTETSMLSDGTIFLRLYLEAHQEIRQEIHVVIPP
jgi:hypothetical protein